MESNAVRVRHMCVTLDTGKCSHAEGVLIMV